MQDLGMPGDSIRHLPEQFAGLTYQLCCTVGLAAVQCPNPVRGSAYDLPGPGYALLTG